MDSPNPYKACIPWNRSFPQTLKSQGLQQALPPDPNKTDVHIVAIICLPASPGMKGYHMLAPLIQSFKQAITAMDLTPSQAAKSKNYTNIQSSAQRILDCRCARDHPINTVAPPIELFNPAFAFFSGNAFNPAYNVPDGVIRDVRRLAVEFAQIHKKEDDRRSHILLLLERTLNLKLSRITNTDQTRPDLVGLGQCGPLQTYLVVAEDKNEFGDGGSDPSTQTGFSFQRILCQAKNEEICLRSCCPAFLIAHAGPWLTIMGGIIAGDCVVQRFTSFLWIPVRSTHDDDQLIQTARIFYALRESIERLNAWYKNLNTTEPFDESLHRSHPRFFPFPNAYKDGDNLVRFEYQVPLGRDVSCVTYRAKTIGNDPQDIVVKFVTKYGEDVHRAMALAGLAPKLLYYGEIDVEQGMPSFGNLRMVVMEYVDGQALDKALVQGKVPRGVQSDLRDALRRLHDAGYVHGDLRSPNVIITCKDEVRLIDFDWSGLDGEVKYPIALPTGIDWPTGVEELAPVRKEHDDAMLDALLKSI